MTATLFKKKPLMKRLESAMLSAVKAAGGSAWYVPDDFLVLGPELITNGDFSNGTAGWTASTNTAIANVSGELEITANGSTSYPGASQVIQTTVGKTYQVTVKSRRGTSASSTGLAIPRYAGAGNLIAVVINTSTTPGQYTTIVTSDWAAWNVLPHANGNPAVAGTVYFDDISIREVLSAKDFQYTSGETPSYLGGSVGLMYDALAQLGADKNTLPYSGWSKSTGVTTDGDSLILADFSTSLSTYGMIGIEQGKLYRISYTISEYVSGNIKAICSTSVSGAVRSTNGTYTEILVPSSTDGNFGFQPSTLNFTGKIRVNYVREVTGTMVSQATAANKPTITRIPRKLGPELIVNGNFDADASGWTSGVATLTQSSGELQVTSTGAVYGYARQSVTVEVGKTYQVKGKGRLGTANLAWILAGTGADALAYTSTSLAINSTTQSIKSTTFAAKESNLVITLENNNAVSNATSFFDEISVREVLEWSYALTFDGSNDSLAAPASIIGSNLSQPYTMIVWGRVGAIGAISRACGDGVRRFGIDATAKLSATHSGSGTRVGNSTLSAGQPFVAELVYSSGTVGFTLNGISDGGGALGDPTGTVGATNVGQSGASSEYWNDAIVGVLVCPAVMTDAQRLAVRKFAAAQMGMSL